MQASAVTIWRVPEGLAKFANTFGQLQDAFGKVQAEMGRVGEVVKSVTTPFASVQAELGKVGAAFESLTNALRDAFDEMASARERDRALRARLAKLQWRIAAKMCRRVPLQVLRAGDRAGRDPPRPLDLLTDLVPVGPPIAPHHRFRTCWERAA